METQELTDTLREEIKEKITQLSKDLIWVKDRLRWAADDNEREIVQRKIKAMNEELDVLCCRNLHDNSILIEHIKRLSLNVINAAENNERFIERQEFPMPKGYSYAISVDPGLRIIFHFQDERIPQFMEWGLIISDGTVENYLYVNMPIMGDAKYTKHEVQLPDKVEQITCGIFGTGDYEIFRNRSKNVIGYDNLRAGLDDFLGLVKSRLAINDHFVAGNFVEMAKHSELKGKRKLKFGNYWHDC